MVQKAASNGAPSVCAAGGAFSASSALFGVVVAAVVAPAVAASGAASGAAATGAAATGAGAAGTGAAAGVEAPCAKGLNPWQLPSS